MPQKTNEKGLDERKRPKSSSKRKTPQHTDTQRHARFLSRSLQVCLMNKGKLGLIKTTEILTVHTTHNITSGLRHLYLPSFQIRTERHKSYDCSRERLHSWCTRTSLRTSTGELRLTLLQTSERTRPTALTANCRTRCSLTALFITLLTFWHHETWRARNSEVTWQVIQTLTFIYCTIPASISILS